ncbi:MAG TPA: tetratricopeptide repeat protein [Kofleriaceae bacterium]|nr:tetratricopeptide repeat protein [Kofleriaceae bacterium]
MSDGDATDVDDTRREGPPRKMKVTAERLAPGDKVGRYVVIDVLGAGGMGVVYSAFDPELDRKVAIKLLQAQTGGSESGGQTWLLREAQAMARLAHPNVVAVHDVGTLPGERVFVAMELIAGKTLRRWLDDKRSWREIVPVMRAAGAGLAAAHAAGLVHRDFKPDNVLVGDDGRTRVMDFGLARLHGGDDDPASRGSDQHVEAKSPLSERLTETGTVLGTPAYMAPEIYRGEPADARADQFAFGVALYEALYRRRPFERKDLVAQRATAPKPPASAKVPTWLERIAMRAIALDPTGRFASMDALLAALAKDPTAGRKRIALGGVLVLALAGLAVGAVGLRGEPASELCTGASDKLAGAWDASTRTAVEAAFRKLGKPYAEDALHGTEKTLDAYAASWVAMRTEACRATRVGGYQSEDVLTLRMQCLDNRLVELATLIGLYAHADDQLVRDAVTSAQKLGPIADCADIPALLAPDPLPKDPIARAPIVALQAKLAEARTLYHAGRLGETLALTEAIAPEVARVKHLPTEAELHLIAGQTRWVLQSAERGEPELMKAVFAAEAGKADEVKLEAWLQLTNLATESSRFDVATERWQQTAAALARVGDNKVWSVRVAASHALLLSRQNKYDDAIAAAKQARAIAELAPDTPEYAYALLVEASILSAAGHAQPAYDDFRKVLAFEDALGHRRIEVGVTLQNLAAAELQLGKVDDAIQHARGALEIDESIYGPTSVEVARVLGALGGTQLTKGDANGAIATYQRAIEVAAATEGEHSELYAQLIGQLANTYVAVGRMKEALPYLDHALAIDTAKLGAGHLQTLTLLVMKCDALRGTNQLDAAVATCTAAAATAEQALGPTSPILFVFYAHLGETLLDAKQARKAAAALDRALQAGGTDPSDVYEVALLDARALWDSGDRKRALALAHKARDGFATLGDGKRDQLREVDDWLAHHR